MPAVRTWPAGANYGTFAEVLFDRAQTPDFGIIIGAGDGGTGTGERPRFWQIGDRGPVPGQIGDRGPVPVPEQPVSPVSP